MLTPTVLTTPVEAGAATSHAPRHAPNFVGLTRAQVYALAKKDAIYFQTSGPGAATGTWVSITSQSPKPGTVIAWNAIVHLVVALVNPHAARPVPNFTGLSRAQVYAMMRGYSFYFSTTGPGAANGTWNKVVGQYPYAGTMVPWHGSVVLHVTIVKVAKPKPKPTPTTTSTTTTTLAGEPTTTLPGDTSTTTTTAPVVTTTTVKKAAVRYRIGDATWYSYIPGQCATWYLPLGTRVTVRNLANGRTISCLVTDREAAHGNRVVDLSETQFSELSPLAKGVIRVKVSW